MPITPVELDARQWSRLVEVRKSWAARNKVDPTANARHRLKSRDIKAMPF